MSWINIFLLSTLAGLGFCFIFSVRPRNILICALCSGMTWTSLQYFQSLGINSVFATLISGFMLGAVTEIAAVKLKSPAINFVIIGFIPLVPGLKTYQGLLHLIEGRQSQGTALLFEAIFIAVAIAVSILLSSSIARVIRVMILKNKKLN